MHESLEKVLIAILDELNQGELISVRSMIQYKLDHNFKKEYHENDRLIQEREFNKCRPENSELKE